jgi:hypothetical protein
MMTRSKSKSNKASSKEETICSNNNTSCQEEDDLDNKSIQSDVEETTSTTLNAKLIDSLKTIIRRQEFTISTLKSSLETKNEKIESLERKNKDLNNYLAEVLLLTLRTRSEIFPEGSKLINYSSDSDMDFNS